MKREKSPLIENDRKFHSVAQKIGLAMILQVVFFYALNILSTILSGILTEILIEEVAYVISEVLFMISYLSGFLIPAGILYKILGKDAISPRKNGRSMPPVAPLFILGGISINFCAAYFNQLLVSALIPTPDGSSLYATEPMVVWYQYVCLLISTAVIPAICEEILFRGVILTNLIPFGRGTAILASGILFGLMHGNILQFFYTSFFGIVLGYIYVRTRSLWLCMIIHFVNNGIGVLQESMGSLVEPELATQINSGIEIFVMVTGVLSLILLLILEHRKRKPQETGSFGVVFEPALEYEEYSVTPKQKWSLFFTPTMIIFLVIEGILMLITAVSLLALWVAV